MVVALVGLAVATAVPATTGLVASVRADAAARDLASELRATRFAAVAKGRAIGLRFRPEGDVWVWDVVVDGNANGIRSREIERGVDRTVSVGRRLGRRVSGVEVRLPDRTIPRVPPGDGDLEPGGDPVRFGRSDIVAFGPLGTASSGALYLTDAGGPVRALVLFGPSARVRLWRYDDRAGDWRR